MRSIAVARQMPDLPGARRDAAVTGARFASRTCSFDYGRGPRRGGVLRDLDLDVAPGERVGLVGPLRRRQIDPGATCCSRFYRPESGRILIDGQDIAAVTQESLRAQIGMVTQDTSLLHRSIRDNIRYGRPEASEAEIVDAARRPHALEFIEGLEDWHGRTGFDAHVGERGVKLSGGQRQRIALARVILKDAPILVLDEATSALDSEVEAAIQEQLDAADGGPHGHRDRAPPVDDLRRWTGSACSIAAASSKKARTSGCWRQAAPMQCCGAGNRAGSASIASATPRGMRRAARCSTRCGCDDRQIL